MSAKEKNEEATSKKAGLPLVTVDYMLSAVEAIRAKGGSASVDVIATTMSKSKGTALLALSACAAFDLVSSDGDTYHLKGFGLTFASANESDMKNLLRDAVLRYPPYHTVLLRLKNAPDNTLPKSDVTKAWFDLFKTGADQTRKKNTAAFASMCDWSGIVENRKNEVILKQDALSFLGAAPPPKPISSLPQQPSAPSPPLLQQSQSQPTTSVQPLATTISIDISVDTRDEKSVRNLLRIIKALRGAEEDEQQTEPEQIESNQEKSDEAQPPS
jgi:hypothetical protein